VRNAIRPSSESDVKIKAVVHEAEEGGFWPKCLRFQAVQRRARQLLRNLHEAIEACLSAATDIEAIRPNR